MKNSTHEKDFLALNYAFHFWNCKFWYQRICSLDRIRENWYPRKIFLALNKLCFSFLKLQNFDTSEYVHLTESVKIDTSKYVHLTESAKVDTSEYVPLTESAKIDTSEYVHLTESTKISNYKKFNGFKQSSWLEDLRKL